VAVRRNEYVTRLSDFEQLEYLLDYLLPAFPEALEPGLSTETSAFDA